MTELRIRVSLEKDGKTHKRELMLNGVKLCDLTHVEVVEFIMQAASSLRYK
jgi:hypothetical protein